MRTQALSNRLLAPPSLRRRVAPSATPRGVQLPPLQLRRNGRHVFPRRDAVDHPPSRGRRLAPPDVKTRQTIAKHRGEQGFRKTTVTTTATHIDGEVMWEEIWWDASDWNGLKELGAEKKGKDDSGKVWHEQRLEKMFFDTLLRHHVIHKTCTKSCEDPRIDEEWEEAWEECFVQEGVSKRWSKKWGKRGIQVWHENWGDELSSDGNGILWTDKWYEDMFDGEGVVHWGEKWEVTIEGKCEMSKWGENWRKGSSDEYRRWWRESKSRNEMTIRRSGHSTSGEHWDVTESLKEDAFAPVVQTDRYRVALEASPQLQAVAVLPQS